MPAFLSPSTKVVTNLPRTSYTLIDTLLSNGSSYLIVARSANRFGKLVILIFWPFRKLFFLFENLFLDVFLLLEVMDLALQAPFESPCFRCAATALWLTQMVFPLWQIN